MPKLMLLVLLAACSGTSGAPEPEPSPPVVTVLWSGRDGVLYMGPGGTDHAPLGDPAVLSAVTPGRGARLTLDADGRVMAAELVPDAPIVQSLPEYPLSGTVVSVEPDRVQVDHAEIPGFMGAMVMPFSVTDEVHGWVRPGDRIEARLVPSPGGYWLLDVMRTGRAAAPADFGVEPVAPGDPFPRTELGTAHGVSVVVGVGQDKPTVLTYLYSTCPDPAFCPALVAKLQPLQAAIGDDARIVAVTIDPETDTAPVLAAYAEAVGADPARWVFARPSMAQLGKVAQLGGLTVAFESGRIAHSTRLLVLAADGTLIERYDDNTWPQERVVEQLRAARKGAP